jgi:hypothetical protein
MISTISHIITTKKLEQKTIKTICNFKFIFFTPRIFLNQVNLISMGYTSEMIKGVQSKRANRRESAGKL